MEAVTHGQPPTFCLRNGPCVSGRNPYTGLLLKNGTSFILEPISLLTNFFLFLLEHPSGQCPPPLITFFGGGIYFKRRGVTLS